MAKSITITITIVVFCSCFIFGCGGGDGSVSEKVCDRLDECNLLIGMSTSECIENGNKALDDLTSTDRADCERNMTDCLKNESCSNYSACFVKYYIQCGLNALLK
jgi:hypothetical protein